MKTGNLESTQSQRSLLKTDIQGTSSFCSSMVVGGPCSNTRLDVGRLAHRRIEEQPHMVTHCDIRPYPTRECARQGQSASVLVVERPVWQQPHPPTSHCTACACIVPGRDLQGPSRHAWWWSVTLHPILPGRRVKALRASSAVREGTGSCWRRYTERSDSWGGTSLR